MRFYVGKHLGGGFVVGTSISTRRGAGKDDSIGCFAIFGIISGLVLGGILGGLCLWLTESYILSFVVSIGAFMFGLCKGIWADMKFEEEQQQEKEFAKISEKLEKCVAMISEGKTVATRQNNCAKAIALLKDIQAMPLDTDRIETAVDLTKVLSVTKEILPIADYLEKAERAEFKGHTKKSLNYYLDVLHTLKKSKISDEDFMVAQLTDGDTGDVITTQFIVRKAKSLGWTKGM